MQTSDLSNYLKTHYGACSAEKCTCIVYGWLGEQCQNWNSCKANTFEELQLWQLNMIKERKSDSE
jgi:hypothetical protein